MASSYLTVEQFDAHLTGDLRGRAENAQLEAALDRAAAEVDSYLRAAGYDLPVANDDAPADVQGRVADIARYHLAVVLRLMPQPPAESSLYLDYQAAIDWLKSVAAGRVTLDLDLETEGEGPGEAYVVTQEKRDWGDGW